MKAARCARSSRRPGPTSRKKLLKARSSSTTQALAVPHALQSTHSNPLFARHLAQIFFALVPAGWRAFYGVRNLLRRPQPPHSRPPPPPMKPPDRHSTAHAAIRPTRLERHARARPARHAPDWCTCRARRYAKKVPTRSGRLGATYAVKSVFARRLPPTPLSRTPPRAY